MEELARKPDGNREEYGEGGWDCEILGGRERLRERAGHVEQEYAEKKDRVKTLTLGRPCLRARTGGSGGMRLGWAKQGWRGRPGLNRYM